MDHKVSKDMISSGMTPSGEKTQADLARTQYGSAPSPSRLMDAYKSMYEHHQKDKDGNTIPHNEDINEGKIPAGLQTFLDKKKGNKKDDGDGKKSKKGKGKPDFLDLDKDGDKKEPMKKASKEMKEGYKGTADLSKADPAAKKKVEDRIAKHFGTKRVPGGKMGVKKEETDLFDTILNHFINEGYDEKDIIQAMSSLTEEQLREAAPLALLAPLLGKGAAAGAAAKGAAGVAAAKGAGATIAKSGISRTIQRAGIKMGGKTGGRIAKGFTDYAKSDVGKMDLMNRAGNTVASAAQGSGEKVNKTGLVTAQPQKKAVAASADLFDIVKGQLLDEGLSEEEIRDIMLALTPEEIMNEMAVNPNIAAMDAKNKADMIARAQANKVPDKVREASKRQMKAGTPREDKNNPYTTQDKKTIIDYNKNK